MNDKNKPAVWVVYDPVYKRYVYMAEWKEACHEHINDAITEYHLDGAETWVVRPLYADLKDKI